MATLYDLFKIPVGSLGVPGAPFPFKVTTGSGDGVTDDTASIQSDINSLPSGGGMLFFPPGTYRLTAPIIINRSGITIQGSGDSTVLRSDGDYGHIIDARPDVDPTTAGAFTGLQLFGFQIQSKVNRTTGSAIHTKWTHAATFRDLRIGTLQYNDPLPVFFWDGITLENESAAVISCCQIYARHYGTYFSGHKLASGDYIGTNWWNGLITGGCNIWGQHTPNVAGSAGVFFAGGGGGLQVEQTGIAFYENGVHVAGVNRELFLGHAFVADDIGGHGILVDVGALQILQITGGWTAGCGRLIGGDGIHITDGVSSLRTVIAGGTFYSNVGQGIHVGQGIVLINGANLNSNGTGDIVLASQVTGAVITGTSMTSFNNSSSITPILRGNLGVVDSG